MSDRTTSTFQRGQQTEDTVKAVATVFDRDAGRYERLLPSHVSLDDFRNAFLTSVQRNPKLLEADRASFWLALQQAAGDGLKCDNREAALVIFSDTDDEDEDGGKKAVARSSKPKQVVYMPMVAGLRKLLRNTGLVSTIETELIYRGEVIELWREDGKRHFRHVVNTTAEADRSDKNIVGAYAVVNFRDGTWQVEWMSRTDIEKVRAVSRAKSSRAPWQAWYSEMAKKTPLRRLIKQLDKSPEIAALDKALENDPTLGATIDGEATEIAEGIAARPTETTRQRPAATQESRATSQPAQTEKVHVEDPNDWRNNHGETTREPVTDKPPVTQQRAPLETAKTDTVQKQPTTTKTAEQPAQGKATATPAKETPFDPETGEITETGQSGPDEGMFEAWVVSADGGETTVDPYTDAMQFAAALTNLCAGKSHDVIAAILENNEGAIGDCRDMSDAAGKIIDSIKSVAPVVNKAQADPKEQPSGQAEEVTLLAIPTTPGGKPHSPNYATAAKDILDRCRSPAEATAWMDLNKPHYLGKITIAAENQIQRHYDQVMAAFDAIPFSEDAADPDRDLANKIINDLNNAKSLDDLRTLNQRDDVKNATARWEKDNKDLYDRVRSIAMARRSDLTAQG